MGQAEIGSIARLLIDLHGLNAKAQAAMRADRARIDGCLLVSDAWQRVGETVGELQRATAASAFLR